MYVGQDDEHRYHLYDPRHHRVPRRFARIKTVSLTEISERATGKSKNDLE